MNLREERARLFKENGELLEEARKAGRPLTAEESASYDSRDARITEITGTLEREDSHARTESALDAIAERAPRATATATGDAPDPEARFAGVFNKYLRHGMRGMSMEDLSVLDNRAMSVEARAQSAVTATAGGYLIPQGFRNVIIETLKAFGGLRQFAESLDTATGNTLPWPTSDETAAEGAIIDENTAVADLDITLGQASLGAYLYSSKMVKTSRVLLQDSAFDLERWLGKKIAERVARIQAKHLATGTGSGQPQGLVTGVASGKTVTLPTGNTVTVTYNGLVDTVHKIDPAYRVNGRWIVGDGFVQAARKLVDGVERPLWVPSMLAGVPDSLLGYPVTVDYGIATPAAGAISALFGDIAAAMVIRNVLGFEVTRLDERYAELGQVAFLGWARMDAKVQDQAAFSAMKHSAS